MALRAFFTMAAPHQANRSHAGPGVFEFGAGPHGPPACTLADLPEDCVIAFRNDTYFVRKLAHGLRVGFRRAAIFFEQCNNFFTHSRIGKDEQFCPHFALSGVVRTVYDGAANAANGDCARVGKTEYLAVG